MTNNDIVPGFDDDKEGSLKIRLQRYDSIENCIVLYLMGYIDTYNSNNFQKRVGKAIEAGFTRIIFHCAELNYVSSTGIGSFTAFLKQVKPLGGDLVLLEVQPKVYEVFQLLGFSQFFNIMDRLEDAAVFFRQRSASEEAFFPLVISCPICSRKLNALHPGRFRCSECKTILAVDDSGRAFLG
jgi:anti-anti-sigma factor